MKQLESLVKWLEKAGQLDDYDGINKEQLQEGIIEEVPLAATGREIYIPNKGVVSESAQTTKMRIMYDASAKAYDSAPSLNDCLEVGPPLQNQLWKVLLWDSFHAVALSGVIRKAFQFHWIDKEEPLRIHTYRITRALFGLGPLPFLLGGVIKQHLNHCRADHPECVDDIERELYVALDVVDLQRYSQITDRPLWEPWSCWKKSRKMSSFKVT